MDLYDVEYDFSVEVVSLMCFFFGVLFFEILFLYVFYVQFGELSDYSINCLIKFFFLYDVCDCNVLVMCMLYFFLIFKLFSQFREFF